MDILIAGGGIAGLTAALAFARRGLNVRVFERAAEFQDIGAGIQLSPNATRLLEGLGVLEKLRPTAVQPEAVVLRRASSLAEVARIPLGAAAEQRWGAPYLTLHRADLHNALLEAALARPGVTLSTSSAAKNLHFDPLRLAVESDKVASEIESDLVVAADGVWSTIRGLSGLTGESRFIGQLAWRRTLEVDDPAAAPFLTPNRKPVVSAFLHPGFHLIAYPISAGRQVNIVAFTKGREILAGWDGAPDIAVLRQAMTDTAPALSALAVGDGWTAWPIHVANLDGSWHEPSGLALIGDAAHAMTPFAAQGAAMAIEDAVTLAEAVAGAGDNLGAALEVWTVGRRRRVLRVARRGALNEFAWHARGPVAAARDAFLKVRGGEKLAADLDWLYGWRPDSA